MCADQGDRDPYWARPWPAALALAQLVLQQPDLVKGKRVCDFGCGLGLAGIAAALSGAYFVSVIISALSSIVLHMPCQSLIEYASSIDCLLLGSFDNCELQRFNHHIPHFCNPLLRTLADCF